MSDKVSTELDFSYLPGSELVTLGLLHLKQNILSEEALLVLIASPRLKRLNINIPEINIDRPYEHKLYSLIASKYGASAHSYYNSLIRRIVSFSRALEQERS